MKESSNLNTLISSMEPALLEGQYLFCTVSKDKRKSLTLDPWVEIHEAEGVSMILKKEEASREKLDGQFPSRLIRLKVSPRYDAVGFLAVVATRLATHGIPLQPIAGFFHGYLLVPTNRADEAAKLLEGLVLEYRKTKGAGEELRGHM
jgi:hypothetical protein